MSRTRSVIDYASRSTGVNFDKWLTWAAIAGALYLGYKTYSAVSAVTGAVGAGVKTARDALASGLYRVFGPTETFNDDYILARFPDGKNHAIPTSRIDPATQTFVNHGLSPSYPGDGKTYKLLVDKRQTTGVNKTAFPL